MKNGGSHVPSRRWGRCCGTASVVRSSGGIVVVAVLGREIINIIYYYFFIGDVFDFDFDFEDLMTNFRL